MKLSKGANQFIPRKQSEFRYGEHDSRWETEAPFYEGYMSFKNKQVMTTDNNGKVDHKEPIDNRSSFEVLLIA